jgi:hypothetical protein
VCHCHHQWAWGHKPVHRHCQRLEGWGAYDCADQPGALAERTRGGGGCGLESLETRGTNLCTGTASAVCVVTSLCTGIASAWGGMVPMVVLKSRVCLKRTHTEEGGWGVCTAACQPWRDRVSITVLTSHVLQRDRMRKGVTQWGGGPHSVQPAQSASRGGGAC